MTTKLREKFVARIPVAGARSHAKGERKGGRKREGEDGSSDRRDEDRRKLCPPAELLPCKITNFSI